ncbi:anti-sigma factor [Streptomyces sp. 8N616]|uniref:anti-sigma factor n=1 Tax=Streptomyces sp. 8N616 TaxID=3457414 RepID=UPI003FD1E2F0
MPWRVGVNADVHTLTGAYVLDALSPQEREAFEEHLAECEACAREVQELRATAAQLGLAVAVPVPPGMKDEVMRRITTVRQVEPVRRAEPVRQVEPPSAPALAPAPGPQAPPGVPRPRRQGRLPRMVLAACVAVAAAFGGIGVWQYQEAEQARREARQSTRQADEVAAVLTAPDATSVSQPLGDGARGTVVVSRAMGKAAFFAAGLPTLSGGRVYQLWYDDAGAVRSAGLVPAGAETETVLAGPVGSATGMAISVEPAGGSAQPTTEPLAQFSFAQPG